MALSISTFLMFEGDADDALALYRSVFSDFEMVSEQRYGADVPALEGKILVAETRLHGHSVMLSNSSASHDFSFTPSVSLFVQCKDEVEQSAAFAALSEGGSVLMPLDDYGFSKRFGWCEDRFGVSWQLNLPG